MRLSHDLGPASGADQQAVAERGHDGVGAVQRGGDRALVADDVADHRAQRGRGCGQPVGTADEGGHVVTGAERLHDDLASGPTVGSQDDKLHET